MRYALPVLAALFLLPALLSSSPASAADHFSCSQVPDAQRFVDGLHPGPNTTAAQMHLKTAKNAPNEARCTAELKRVDYYARRSAAADKRASTPTRHRRVVCADAVHQNRPGGSDYRGPSRGCPRVM
jgi:hypothetical protein